MRARRAAGRVVAALTALALLAAAFERAHGQASDSALARLSVAFLWDASGFGQDSINRLQLGTIPTVGEVRRDRVTMRGVVRFPSPWSYLFSADYDGLERGNKTVFTVNDLAILVPLGGNATLSVGRQKEGVTEQMISSIPALSLAERPAPPTAFVPTRNDGIRIAAGQAEHGRWSVGWFNSFHAASVPKPSGWNQLAGRGFVTGGDIDSSSIVQVGISMQWISAPNGVLRFRAKPETNEAPYVVDTHSFDSHGATTLGLEVVAQRGGWSFVSEALATSASEVDSSSASFGGYYAEVSWRPGHEVRTYDAANGILGPVHLRKDHSAWEIATRFSHTDLSSRNIDGGVFDRTSLVASWYARRWIRLVADYGYGVLNRGGMVGHMQFATGRVQWESP